MTFVLTNVAVKFKNCTFYSVTIKTSEKNSKGSLNVILQQTNWLFDYNVEDSQVPMQNHLLLLNQETLHLIVIDSYLVNTILKTKSKYCHISVMSSSFKYDCHFCKFLDSGFTIERENVFFVPHNYILFSNVEVIARFRKSITDTSKDPVHLNSVLNMENNNILSVFLDLNFENTFLSLVNCTFQQMSQALYIHTSYRKQKNDGIFLNMSIINSTFFKIRSNHYGGAIFISLSKSITPLVLAEIKLTNSTFTDIYTSGQGGALYVVTKPFHSIYNRGVNIKIISSHFENCLSTGNGGSIYIGLFIQAELHRVAFVLNITKLYSRYGIFCFSEGSLILSEVTFEVNDLMIPTVVLKSSRHLVIDHVKLKCPDWHFPSVSFDTHSFVGVSCKLCKGSLYAPFVGSIEMVYQKSSKKLQFTFNMMEINQTKCKKCPLGGVCLNGRLRPRPGYWGMSINNEYCFFQCPAAYCCMDVTCNFKDPCSNHRIGKLCGKCKEGYSLSLLSDECIANSQCSAAWEWLLLFIITGAYVLWFLFRSTLKQMLNSGKVILQNMHKKSSNGDRLLKGRPREFSTGHWTVLVYFVQIQGLIQLDHFQTFDENIYVKSLENILLSVFGVNPSKIIFWVCPTKILNAETKVMVKFLFMSAFYIVWFVLYGCVRIFCKVFYVDPTTHSNKRTQNANKAIHDLLLCIIAITKYTYIGFAELCFLSLVCIEIDGHKYWKFDAEIQCFASHQWFFLALSIIYVFPFPIAVIFSKLYLPFQKRSEIEFVLSCVFPFPFLAYILMKVINENFLGKSNITPGASPSRSSTNENVKPRKRFVEFCNAVRIIDFGSCGHNLSIQLNQCACLSNQMSKITDKIDDPYNNSVGMYWDGVFALRKLVIALSILINNSILKYIYLNIICITILLHHYMVKPFKERRVNSLETFSLILITIVTNINTVKAGFVTIGLRIVGPTQIIITFISVAETSLVLIFIIGFIIPSVFPLRWWKVLGEKMKI